MAGLAAAWELSRPEHRDQVSSITVYERRRHLGGKGASVRGVHGRIEEHGLHVWPGYYDNAFRLVRQVYDELDRPRTDPACPIKTWREAFRPSDLVGVSGRDGSASTWMASFGRNGLQPGEPLVESRPMSIVEFSRRAVGLLADASRSLSRSEAARPAAGLFLSSSADPMAASRRRSEPTRSLAAFAETVRQAEIAALAAALQGLDGLERSGSPASRLRDVLLAQVDAVRDELFARLRNDEGGLRVAQLVDLVTVMLRGMVADRLGGDPDRLASIDHLDFRDWLRRHGAREETLRSPLLEAMYDFVFAYEDGDPERPAFAAGLGLLLSAKLFFEYKGSIFWKMNAGMGDIVFVPLYQALRARGVRFEVGHAVERIGLADDERSIGEVVMTGVTAAATDDDTLDVLVRVRGLPCFPSSISAGVDGVEVRLRRGEHFDDVVLAIALGGLPHICGELIDASPAWQRMVANVQTVPTHAFQAWLTCSEDDLGWTHAGATMSGWARPFDTYASMGHLLAMEDWPADGNAPRGLAYFCSTLGAESAPSGTDTSRAAAWRTLEGRVGEVWPGAFDADGFRWDVLHGGFDAQHFATNTDASDRYVQSLPGTSEYRLRADQSGYDNLVLAGDWINCGLNAGCIEAAAISGLQAANVTLGRPLNAGVSGSLYGLGRRESAA